MRHIVLDFDDVPAAPPIAERRMGRDRRDGWRGGRRDSDWHVRPPGALGRLYEPVGQPSRWLVRLTSLNLW